MQEKVEKEKSSYETLAIFQSWEKRIAALRLGSDQPRAWLQVEATQWVGLIEKDMNEPPHSAGKTRLLKLMQAIVYKIFQTIYMLNIVRNDKESFFLRLSKVKESLDKSESQITDINVILKELGEQLPLGIKVRTTVRKYKAAAAKKSLHTTGCKITRWWQRLWNKDANPGDKLKGKDLFEKIEQFPTLAHEVLKDRGWFGGKNLWKELSNEQVFDLFSMKDDNIRRAILRNNNPTFRAKLFYGIRGVIEGLQLQLPKVNTGSAVKIEVGLMDRLNKLHHPDMEPLFVGPSSLWREPRRGRFWWSMLHSRMQALDRQSQGLYASSLQKDHVIFSDMQRAKPKFF